MVSRWRFNKIKKENPESRIGKRTREEQEVRNDLAKTLIKAKKKGVETPLDGYIDEKIKLKKEKEVWENEKENRENEKQKILEDIKMLKEQYDKCLGEINEIKKKKAYEMLDNLEQNIDSLSYPEMLRSLNKIKDSLEQVIKSNRPRNFEQLRGNPYNVVADLKKNYLKVEENVEMYGYKGKIVHIELPSVGGFKGYKFDYFISDETVDLDTYRDIMGNIRYHTKISFGEFLNKLNAYMQQFDIDLDSGKVYAGGRIKKNENYAYGIDYRYTHSNYCQIGEYVRQLFAGCLGHCWLGGDMLFLGEDFCFDSAGSVGVYDGYIMARI